MTVGPIIGILTLAQFSKRAQEIMSSTATNYDIRRLEIGISLAAIATLAGFITNFEGLLLLPTTGLWALVFTIAYGVMMFASSYVEEEHHFWYWGSSGWLAWLVVKQ